MHMSKAEPANKKIVGAPIPPWPFVRRSETITREEWPGIYKKIRDKAVKQLERENDQAQLTIRELLDKIDVLLNGAASAESKLAQVRELIKID
jgi:hypothetical protein